jgi:hypothetical protein
VRFIEPNQRNLIQAGLGKFSRSTIERKQMSTKTTFKRIALVAVAALALGSFSAVSASAVPTALANGVVLPTVAALSAPSTATAGVAVTGIFSHNGLTNGYGATTVSTKAYIVAAPTTSTLAPNAPVVSLYTGTTYTGTTGVTTTATDSSEWGSDSDYNKVAKSVIDTPPAAGSNARITAYFNVSFTPDKAGTYTIAVKNQQDASQLATWTVTAVDPVAITAAGSTVLIASSTTTPSTTTDAVAVTGSKSLTAAVAGNISVAAGNSTTADSAVSTGTLSATITGSGLVSWTNVRTAASRSVAAAAAGKTGTLYVFSDGTSGPGTITISSGSTVIGTKTVTFYGSVASLTVTGMAKSVVDTADGGANTDTDAFVGVVTAKDSAGVTVPVVAGDFTVSSATELTAQSLTGAAAVAGPAPVSPATSTTINGVAVTASSVVLVVDPTATKTGAKTLTLTHTATTIATTFSFTVALAAATTVAVTNDQASPVPGQKITYTVTSKDAGGNAIPDGSAVAVAVTTSLSQSTTLPTTLAFAGGVATFSLYAPVTPGTQTVTVTQNTIVGTTASDVVDLTAPALDAAAEATDAANAATDAANAAAEAADAATAAAQDAADAVAALSVAVTEMVSALKKQITALTNLVIKIQKKVKA